MPTPSSGFDIAAEAARASGTEILFKKSWPIGAALEGMTFGLSNGLTIIFAADHRAPIFAYQSWFAVGSRDEEPNRTGLAHLFEHLMFKGTTTYPTGTFDAEMERRGAQTNAATWVDWTYYTQALACRGDNFATVVAFEADRMVNLVLDEATFASELEVVKNERRLSVEDNVGGLLGESLMALAYKHHPYRWPTIGSMAHLEAASVPDLESFYRRYYAPNNCTVVVVGDLDPVEALTTIARAYGKLSPSEIVRTTRVAEPVQQGRREQRLVRPIMTPQVVLGYPAPAQSHADHAALEMLVDVLTAGDTGRLHQRLVTDKRLASEITGFLTPFGDPGLIELHLTAVPDVPIERLVAEAELVMEEISQGISEDEWLKARRGLTLGHLDSIKEVEGLAESLGHHQLTLGDAGKVMDAPRDYARIDAQRLAEVARTYLRPERLNQVSVAPQSADGGA